MNQRGRLDVSVAMRADKGYPMIYAIARMTLPPERLEEALEILSSVAQRCRFERGCIRSNVYQDIEQQNAILLEQVWNNEKDMEDHLRSPDYYNVLLVAEMALALPEIRFDIVERSTGVETVEKARSARRGERMKGVGHENSYQ